MFLSNLFNRRPDPAEESDFFSPRRLSDVGPVSIREQMVVLNEDLKALTARIGDLGLSIREDGSVIAVDDPGPVDTLQDAIEYVNTRVDLLHKVVASVEEKLGF